MILDQRVDSLPIRRRLVRQRPVEPGPDLAEPTPGREAVVGVAEYLLHRLDGRIDHVAELRLEAGAEDLHRIAELFAEDADLVELAVIVELLAGRGLELPGQGREERDR